MFHKARIKLTLWYLLIIMIISTSFSVSMYKILTSELNRVEKMQRLRLEHKVPDRLLIVPPQDNGVQRFFILDPEIIEETKFRLKLILIAINFFILGSSAALAYFLAGKTLKPISEMVDEQKRFIADASHELRTPLTAMKTETEVALREKRIDAKNIRELLNSNLEEINKLKSLTDYFLTLSKYQNSDIKISFESFNLSDVISEAQNRIKRLAKEKDIEIIIDIKETRIKANKVSITELITILLDNAIKYNHDGGKIEIKSETIKNNVIIKIEDTGVGIKFSDLPYIFNRFYRVDSSRTKNNISGYGLGLSIAKSIVDLHRGKISVSSVVGKGSVFSITLPLE